MEVEVDESTVAGDLVAALEQATLMAKQLGAAADPSQIAQIHASLHFAHHHLSQFLSQQYPQFHQAPQIQPQRAILPPQPEKSVSSAVGGGEENGETGGGEPMQTGDNDDDEQNSRAVATVEKVEEKMRDCFIQNKRPKRRLSPSAEHRQGLEYDDKAFWGSAVAAEFDPIGNKLRSLALIQQFHA